MAIAMNALTSGFTNATALSYDTASVTPTANALVLIAFTALDNGQLPTGVTGNGLTWVAVKNLRIPSPTSGDTSISVFRAMGASPSAGAITMTYGANQIRCRWSVVEFTGVDTTGTNGSGAIVQAESTLSAGATTLTVTLAAFGSANNVGYGAFAHRAAEGTTFGTGWTEIHDIGAGGASTPTIQTEWQAADDDPDASWVTSSACGAVGIEVKAAAAGAAFNLERLERHYIRGTMRGGLRGVA